MISGRVQRRPTRSNVTFWVLWGILVTRALLHLPTSDWIGTTTILGSSEIEQVMLLRVIIPKFGINNSKRHISRSFQLATAPTITLDEIDLL